MALMPPALIWLWITGLLSLGLLGGGGYLLWAWDEGVLVGTEYLIAGIALVALSFLGRPLATALLGRAARPGEAEPRMERGGKELRIPRPDGSELFVESYGPDDAPVLLLTHGWGLNGTAWYYAKRLLAGRFRLILWDLAGLGASKRPQNNDFELEKMARDLEAVLAHVGDRPVVLCGHSIGGMILLTFCRLFPERLSRGVAGLVLTHTTYTNPVHTAKGARLLRILEKPLLQPLCYLTIALSPLVRLMSWLSYANGLAHLNTHLTQFARKETRGQLDFSTRFSLFSSPSVTARGMLAMLRYDATDVLATIPVPTLVIAANQDQACVPAASQRIADAVPGAAVTTLLPAGHLGLLEQHEEWARAVGVFAEQCLGTEQRRPARV